MMRIKIFVILISVVILIVFWQLEISRKSKVYFPVSFGPSIKPTPKIKIKDLWSERKKKRFKDWKRDPFQEKGYQDLIRELKLEAISIGKGGTPVALINGKFVHEGDNIGLIRILKIGKDYIIVERGTVKMVIKLKEKEVAR